MRVIAGEFAGRRLTAPAGTATRPTADRVREALFSILGPLDGLEVLDLFAGSGALGLEALSRGAARVTFVERDRGALTALRRNVSDLGVEGRVRVVAADWKAALARERRRGAHHGLCLLDPPYSLLPRIAGTLVRALPEVLSPDAVVVVEHAAKSTISELDTLPVRARTDRTYGDTALAVLTLEAP